MSTINTNGINVNYPVPGTNNSTQGFRDNFAAIRTNLNTAASEITDLQNKAVVKSALANSTVNNDMANTLISNAATRSFRHTTYNLGNALSGTVLVDVSLGDVQYGTIAGNTTLQFGNWAPVGTQSNLMLELNFSNTDAALTFPSEIICTDENFGATTLENFRNIANATVITVPYGVTKVNYRLSSLDCGNTVNIEPYNRPRQITQTVQRTPPTTGQLGDRVGTTCVDDLFSATPVTCTDTESTYDTITCDDTTGFFLDMPIVFTGTVFGGVTAGTVYYVRSIPSSTTFTISATPGTASGPSSAVALSTASGSMTGTPVNYLYIATRNFDSIENTKNVDGTEAVITSLTITNTIATGNFFVTSGNAQTLVSGYPVVFVGTGANITVNQTIASGSYLVTPNSTSGLTQGGTIEFAGTSFGNVSNSTTYFVSTIANSTHFKIAADYTNATAGTNSIAVTDASGNLTGTYGGVFGNVSANTTYYVGTIANTTHFTVSATSGGANVVLIDENGSMTANGTTDYVVTFDSAIVANTFNVNDPIIFQGNVAGGIEANVVYYIADVDSPNISISQTRYNGVAGQKMPLTTAANSFTAISYDGTSIFKRVQLNSW